MSPTPQNRMSMILPASHEEHWFRSAIQRILDLGIDTTQLRTHAEWAHLLFCDNTGDANTWGNKMSAVKQAFSIYFDGRGRYTINMDKIKEHYPHWFGVTEEEETLNSVIQRALENEIKESRDPRNVESYRVETIKELSRSSTLHYIYCAEIYIGDGSEPKFREGVEVRLMVGSVYPTYYTCSVLEYDFEEGLLYLSSIKQIEKTAGAYMRIYIDLTFLITRLQDQVAALLKVVPVDYPIYKFITGQTHELKKIEHEDIPECYYQRLDKDQKKAFHASLDKDITFIWGPPGTGKSYTLASIIRTLYYMEEERTAVCCISNVAVDQLVNKVIDIFDEEEADIQPGNLYRAGRTIDDRILKTDYLFPNDDVTKTIRKTIGELKEVLNDKKKIKGNETSVEVIELKDRINTLRDRLKEKTEKLEQKSRVVFSTIANFIGSAKLNQSCFDNLIVDEASMLAFPNLLGLAAKISKRIILVGDFQQLSPISLVPDRYLKTNVFAYCGITLESLEHPALQILRIQRRSHTRLVGLVNEIFYNGELRHPNQRPEPIVYCGAYPDDIIAFADVPEGRVRFTRGGTRQNVAFAEKVIEIIDQYQSVDLDFSIGVITPYKGQQNMLRAMIAKQKYPLEFAERIKVGTVHTFQGSEDDVIIFDMVDCSLTENGKAANIGRIYAGTEGEQLINVAVSRARYKLIVVGEANFLHNIPGNTVTTKLRNMMPKLMPRNATY